MSSIAEIEEKFEMTFHDAGLVGLSVDYVKNEARVEFDLYDGEEAGTGIEFYRRGVLTFHELGYLSVDPPDNLSPKGGDLCECGDWSVEEAVASAGRILLRQLPEPHADHRFFWVFVSRWNGLIRIAAKDVSFEWTGPEQVPAGGWLIR